MPGLMFTGRFKAYDVHYKVKCYQCGRIMHGKPRHDDFPPGRGEWSQHCKHCNLRTWYDINQRGNHDRPAGNGQDEQK